MIEKYQILNMKDKIPVDKIGPDSHAWKAIGKGFRVVHNVGLIEGTDKDMTTSTHEIEEFQTSEKAEVRAKELGLDVEGGV